MAWRSRLAIQQTEMGFLFSWDTGASLFSLVLSATFPCLEIRSFGGYRPFKEYIP